MKRRILLYALTLALIAGGKALLGIPSFPPLDELLGGAMLMVAGAVAWGALS